MVSSKFDLLTSDVLWWVEFGNGETVNSPKLATEKNEQVRHAKIAVSQGSSRSI